MQHNDRKVTRGYRRANGRSALRVPKTVIKANCAPYLQRGKPAHRPRADQPRRPHHRRYLRVTVPGHRPVLPARRRRLPTRPAGMGHEDLHAQDAGSQAPLDGDEDGQQVQDHHRHAKRATQVLRSHHRTSRQETTGRTVRRHSTATATKTRSSTDRDPAVSALRPEKNWSPGYERALRALRTDGHRSKCTKSPNSPTSARPGRHSPRGQPVMAARRRKALIVCNPCHDHIHAGNQPPPTP